MKKNKLIEKEIQCAECNYLHFHSERREMEIDGWTCFLCPKCDAEDVMAPEVNSLNPNKRF